MLDYACRLNPHKIESWERILQLFITLANFSLFSSYILQNIFNLPFLIAGSRSKNNHASYFSLNTMTFQRLVLFNVLKKPIRLMKNIVLFEIQDFSELVDALMAFDNVLVRDIKFRIVNSVEFLRSFIRTSDFCCHWLVEHVGVASCTYTRLWWVCTVHISCEGTFFIGLVNHVYLMDNTTWVANLSAFMRFYD